jgi:DNA-binding response OmpR family regulator
VRTDAIENRMYRIAAIEDDLTMRKLLPRFLSAEGFECVVAVNAHDGWDICLRDKPDLILLDVNLPDEDGLELCRRLKAEPRLRHIPVIIITGEASSVEKRVEGLESGADDFVLKPFEMAELVARIRGILKPGRGRS